MKSEYKRVVTQASTEMLARWILKNLDWSGGNSDENGAFLTSILLEHRRQCNAVVPEGGERWRPIETAPKDGTEILAWREDAGVMLVRWAAPVDFLSERELDSMGEETAHAEDWFCADFVNGDRLEGNLIPTHWMPLPDAPQLPQEGNG